MKLVCSACDKITPMQTNQSSFLPFEDTVFFTLGHRCTLSSPITATGSPPSRPAKQTERNIYIYSVQLLGNKVLHMDLVHSVQSA